MDHSLVNDSDPMVGMPDHHQGSHGTHGSHAASGFFDDMTKGQETELLEMLHVPILHGGVKEVLLLSSLSTTTAGHFAVACIFLVLSVITLELMRLLSWWVENKYSGGNSMSSSSCGCKHCNSLTASVGDHKNYDAFHDSAAALDGPAPQSATSRWMVWTCVGGLQFLVYLLSTFLMLIAMTMNIYLIVSMAVGSAIGKMTTICIKKKLADTRM